jgi:hypothetical protein
MYRQIINNETVENVKCTDGSKEVDLKVKGSQAVSFKLTSGTSHKTFTLSRLS